jgi:hypothetical protein
MSGKMVIKNGLQRFKNANGRLMDMAMERMTRDTATLAKVRMPYREGDMTDNTSVERKRTMRYRVLVNVEYAAYQERGQRKDGTHKVRKYSTPGTGKDFLKGSGQTIARDGLNYLKQAANNLRMKL